MGEKFSFVFLMIIIISIITLAVSIGKDYVEHEYEKGYQKGIETGYVQALKDNHAGVAKYKLVENPDGTRKWERVK